MKKNFVLFGAGEEGVKAIHLLGKERISYFLDNSLEKQGRKIEGISVFSPEKLKGSGVRKVYLSISKQYHQEIIEQIKYLGVHEYETINSLIKREGFKSNPQIKKLKGCFSGKRCFIIGTGPSLKIKDLEELKRNNEISFASNKIFKLFSQTSWRPQLYCVSDMEVLYFYYNQIVSLEIKYQFIVNILHSKYKECVDGNKLKSPFKYIFDIYKYGKVNKKTGKEVPAFSTEVDKYVVDGGITVTYSMLQIAYFLGFREIYLLGVDFDYDDKSGADKKRSDHFCEDYIEEGEVVNFPRLNESFEAYKAAEKFSRKHGFRIYNATRGGKLEVFERISFDSIFK